MTKQEIDLGVLHMNLFVVIKSCAMTSTGEQK